MDHRTDPRHLFDEVIATPDPFEFVRRAYRLVLRREASEAEVRRRGRLLKYVPFYTRDRFLRRLLQSSEAGLIGRATVEAGVRDLVARPAAESSAVGPVFARLDRIEAALPALARDDRADDVLARIARIEAVVATLAPLASWPTPEPYPVSLVCERLDRLQATANGLRAWVEKAAAERKAEWARVGDLRAFERKVYSQQGEDGILEEIFRRIGETNRHFVEFGVETGVECNAARLAHECGWSGLFMEGDPELFAVLKANYAHLPGVRCERAMVQSTNVQQLFADAGVPAEPDLLVIDIDGNDYWVWKALTDYRPRVVVVEYNPFHPPPSRWVMAEDPNYRWQRTDYFGASLGAFCRLGRSKGYELVGADSHGVNAFFVRSDCAADRFPDPAPLYYYTPFAYTPPPHFDGPAAEG